jgi:hypothetical protein
LSLVTLWSSQTWKSWWTLRQRKSVTLINHLPAGLSSSLPDTVLQQAINLELQTDMLELLD